MKAALLTLVLIAAIFGPIVALLPIHQKKPQDPWGEDIK